MNEAQRKQHVEHLLNEGKCKAEAFHIIGEEFLTNKITHSDYRAMAEMLGFPIHPSEESQIYQSLNKEFIRVRGNVVPEPQVQKTVTQA